MRNTIRSTIDPIMLAAVQQFIEEKLLSTKRQGIEEVVEFIRKSDYYTARCGRHHKFAGGMSQHAVETYFNATMNNTHNLSDDSLIIMCLLHDVCDIAHYHHYHGHGKRSVDLLCKECGLQLSSAERNAILWHMHGYKEKETLGEAFSLTTYEPEWKTLRHADGHSAGYPLNRYQLYKQMTNKDYPIDK